MNMEHRGYSRIELGMAPIKRASSLLDGSLSATEDDHLDNRVDERMREVQGCISGIRSPSADRVCLLIEFCYLLDLHQQVVDLYARLEKNDIEQGWLLRVDAIVQVCRMKL